jgi:hypothetical protein
MKYEKPEVLLLPSALTSVRNLSDKSEQDSVDGHPLPCSIAAYAADE